MKTGNPSRIGDWFQTYLGNEFYIMDPKPEEIYIEDIAHALSNQCRYNGHSKYFFSVAQHSVLVSQACKPKNALWGLLHDAAEAYTGDMVRPLKKYMPAFRDVEAKLISIICEAFGLPLEQPDDVTYADNVLLATERKYIMEKPPRPWAATEKYAPLDIRIIPWSAEIAKMEFMARFKEIS